jgi:hypothetical protein
MGVEFGGVCGRWRIDRTMIVVSVGCRFRNQYGCGYLGEWTPRREAGGPENTHKRKPFEDKESQSAN